MAGQISCSNCGSADLKQTNSQNVFSCAKCGKLTGFAPSGGGSFLAKFAGTAAGTFLGFMTLGLLPDEVVDKVENLFSGAVDNVLG